MAELPLRRLTFRSWLTLWLAMLAYALVAAALMVNVFHAPFAVTRAVFLIGEIALIVWIGRFLSRAQGYLLLGGAVYLLAVTEAVERLDAPDWALPAAAVAAGAVLALWSRRRARRRDMADPGPTAR